MTDDRTPPQPYPPALSRRALMGGAGAAGLALTALSTGAQARTWRERVQLTAAALGIGAPPMHDPSLLVAGAAGSPSARFAAAIAPGLGASLPLHDTAHTALPIDTTMGQDGVTGANQFDSTTNPDGNTALVAPGSAWLAWLAGDPRVHFDVTRWVPVLAQAAPGLVVLRSPAKDGSTDLRGRVIRLATSGPTGPQLPAWLGLSLLGAKVVPVQGLVTHDDIQRALADNRIDAAFFSELTGTPATTPLDTAAPLFALGALPHTAESGARDPALPDVPSFAETYRVQFGHAPAGPLYEGWLATASAARLGSVVVLPGLSPAAMVAVWRRAARAIVNTDTSSSAPVTVADAALPAPTCLPACTAAEGNEGAILALRKWLAESAGWRPA